MNQTVGEWSCLAGADAACVDPDCVEPDCVVVACEMGSLVGASGPYDSEAQRATVGSPGLFPALSEFARIDPLFFGADRLGVVPVLDDLAVLETEDVRLCVGSAFPGGPAQRGDEVAPSSAFALDWTRSASDPM